MRTELAVAFSLCFVAPALAFTEKQEGVLNNTANAMVLATRCKTLGLNEMFARTAARFHELDLERPEVKSEIEKRLAARLTKLKSISDQNVCAAGLKFFGPGGIRVPNLLTTKTKEDLQLAGATKDAQAPSAEKRWGAIAYAMTQTKVATAVVANHQSQEDAKQAALAKCSKEGVPGCKDATVFTACGYITFGKGPKGTTGFAVAWASSAEGATRSCRKQGAPECRPPKGECNEHGEVMELLE